VGCGIRVGAWGRGSRYGIPGALWIQLNVVHRVTVWFVDGRTVQLGFTRIGFRAGIRRVANRADGTA